MSASPLEAIQEQTILIAPSDWGMGHTARCVPLIQKLLRENKVILGVTGKNRAYYRERFPQLQQVELPSYDIRYSTFWPAWLKVLFQTPRILKTIRCEKNALEILARQIKIDLVISDSRFGLNHKKIRSIFVSHQLLIGFNWFSAMAGRVNRKFIHKFDELWVPDFESVNDRLSGRLSESQGIKIPVRYIGPLSALVDLIQNKEATIDLLILLSGEEPQRSELEKKLIASLTNLERKIVLIRGTELPYQGPYKKTEVFNFLSGKTLAEKILSAKCIVCRSGYSTLMDVHALGMRKMILIPTPGQPEQEYLAKYWSEKFGATFYDQRHLDKLRI